MNTHQGTPGVTRGAVTNKTSPCTGERGAGGGSELRASPSPPRAVLPLGFLRVFGGLWVRPEASEG